MLNQLALKFVIWGVKKMKKVFPLVSVVINIVTRSLESLYTATSQNMPGFLSTILKGIHEWGTKSITCLEKSGDGCAIKCTVCTWSSIPKYVNTALKCVSVKTLKPNYSRLPKSKTMGIE